MLRDLIENKIKTYTDFHGDFKRKHHRWGNMWLDREAKIHLEDIQIGSLNDEDLIRVLEMVIRQGNVQM